MNWIGLVLVLVGLVYLIYSILCRDKVTYYSKRKEITLINLSEFLKLQLKYSIINSILLIVYGIISIILKFPSVLIMLGVIIFHLINVLLLSESKNKGYIDYK